MNTLSGTVSLPNDFLLLSNVLLFPFTQIPWILSHWCLPVAQGCSAVGARVGITEGDGVGETVGVGVGMCVGAVG